MGRRLRNCGTIHCRPTDGYDDIPGEDEAEQCCSEEDDGNITENNIVPRKKVALLVSSNVGTSHKLHGIICVSQMFFITPCKKAALIESFIIIMYSLECLKRMCTAIESIKSSSAYVC